MDIKTLTSVIGRLPPSMAVLLRGPTGIGKSHIGRQLSQNLGLAFVDVRLSVMSEGDVGGYPDLEAMKTNGVMTMCMPSWFIRAVREPVVLMLDELNRALPGVQQSAFQLILDRELGNDKNGNPYRLHPDTRIVAAVNQGAEYDVNDMDPALLRRFWVADVEPTVEDWINWARNHDIDPVTIDFIQHNPNHFRTEMSKVEAGTVVPTPASWARLDETLQHAGLTPSKICGTRPDGIYAIASGFVGTEAAIAYTTFVEKYEMVITAEDILNSFSKVKDRLKKAEASVLTGLIDNIAHHCKNNEWTDAQGVAIGDFAETLSGELLIHLWNSVSATSALKNIQKVHKRVGQRVVSSIQASRAAEVKK